MLYVWIQQTSAHHLYNTQDRFYTYTPSSSPQKVYCEYNTACPSRPKQLAWYVRLMFDHSLIKLILMKIQYMYSVTTTLLLRLTTNFKGLYYLFHLFPRKPWTLSHITVHLECILVLFLFLYLLLISLGVPMGLLFATGMSTWM